MNLRTCLVAWAYAVLGVLFQILEFRFRVLCHGVGLRLWALRFRFVHCAISATGAVRAVRTVRVVRVVRTVRSVRAVCAVRKVRTLIS